MKTVKDYTGIEMMAISKTYRQVNRCFAEYDPNIQFGPRTKPRRDLVIALMDYDKVGISLESCVRIFSDRLAFDDEHIYIKIYSMKENDDELSCKPKRPTIAG